jgi:branched-chain amino acid transport system permease protein
MMDVLLAYQPLFNQVLIYSILAYSQFIVLRTGVFSVATVGIASIGAYASAYATVRLGYHPYVSTAISVLLGLAAGALIAIPLARLRGIYQAMATIGLVKVIVSLTMYFEGVTGGVLGFNNIPRGYDTAGFLIVTVLVILLLHNIGRSGTGRAFDAIRQDETVAVSLGVSVHRHHSIAFALSGALAGLAGSFIAFFGRSLFPAQFGFELLTEVLAFVVLGGSITVLGPLVGTAILVVLPEFARPLAENTLLFYGAILILVMIFLPQGVAGTLVLKWRRSRQAAAAARAGPTPLREA